MALHDVIEVGHELLRGLGAEHEDELIADPGEMFLILALVVTAVEQELVSAADDRSHGIALGTGRGPSK